MQDFSRGHWSSVAVLPIAIGTVSEPEISQGTGFKLRTDERVRVQEQLRIYLASRAGKDDKRSKEEKAFGLILNLRFLLGWRLRHQAKTMTNNLPILSVLAFRASFNTVIASGSYDRSVKCGFCVISF
jgi:hypothetical protein